MARIMLRRAALAGWRAAGYVEPNPLVGCVIADRSGNVLGIGHHLRFGSPHAEVEALRDCLRRGRSARGATAYVTLEPCNHHGKTPPCVDALLDAGVTRVVAARQDPNSIAAGGAARLRSAGVEVEFSHACPFATRLSDPFVKRVTSGLPFVIAKWAQTIDGKIATRTGDSKWISNEASRDRVHALRARVDVVLTGVGTVVADDPRLTARGVHRRRVARRVVVDPTLRIPIDAALLSTISEAPLTLAHGPLDGRGRDRATILRHRGAELVELPETAEGLALVELLTYLSKTHQAANVLVESGPTLMGHLFRNGLVDRALVFIAPRVLGDSAAYPPVHGGRCDTIAAARELVLARSRALGDDVVLQYIARG